MDFFCLQEKIKNNTKLKYEAIKSGLINEKDYDILVDPTSMTRPS